MFLVVHWMEIVIFLFMVLTKEKVESTAMQFFKRHNKRLEQSTIESAFITSPDQCLGMCVHTDRCKAFNVDHDNCELLEKDRCSAGKVLSDSPGTNYFDTVAEEKCRGEYF